MIASFRATVVSVLPTMELFARIAYEGSFSDMTDGADASSKLADPVLIGVVTTPHGVRGTLRVKPIGSGLHLHKGVSPLAGGERRRILGARQTPKGFLIDFEGVGSREDADAMRGMELFLDRSELGETEEGEIYVSDLVGLEAFDEEGEKVGTVKETFETAAHEVLVISGKGDAGKGDAGKGDAEIYVPFTMEHVPEVEIEAGRITVAPPEE